MPKIFSQKKVKEITFSPGFTLIELLIVIVIISILTTIVVASLIQIQRGARDAQRKSDLRTVAAAIDRFHSDNGYYPKASAGKISYNTGDCSNNSTTDQSWGTGVINCNSKNYLKQLPHDPLPSNQEYCYQTTLNDSFGNPQRYSLLAKLENASDKEKDSTPTTCNGVAGYNYTVTPNQ